jgi:hypothetical protein
MFPFVKLSSWQPHFDGGTPRVRRGQSESSALITYLISKYLVFVFNQEVIPQIVLQFRFLWSNLGLFCLELSLNDKTRYLCVFL